jgi:hypothetical protein
MRHLDQVGFAALRRITAPVIHPFRRLSRWEHDRPPPVVRSVVARPGLVGVLAGLVVVTAASVHVARYPDQVEPEVTAPAPADEVGPAEGTDLERYAAARHELLDQLPGDDTVRAIVSFAAFTPVGSLPLPDDLRVERVHVRLPGEVETRVLAGDDAEPALAALFEEGREDLDREIAELEQLLAEDLGDPAFEREFTEQLELLRATRDGASADAEVAFAAVVVGPVAALRDLAAADPVRLVDVAGPPDRTGDTRFTGVVPRDDDRASTGREGAADPPP